MQCMQVIIHPPLILLALNPLATPLEGVPQHHGWPLCDFHPVRICLNEFTQDVYSVYCGSPSSHQETQNARNKGHGRMASAPPI